MNYPTNVLNNIGTTLRHVCVCPESSHLWLVSAPLRQQYRRRQERKRSVSLRQRTLSDFLFRTFFCTVLRSNGDSSSSSKNKYQNLKYCNPSSASFTQPPQPARKRAITTTPTESSLLSSSSSVWEQMDEGTRRLAQSMLLQVDDIDDDDERYASSSAHDRICARARARARAVRFQRRAALARAITLIESSSFHHQKQANLLLTYLLTYEDTGNETGNKNNRTTAGRCRRNTDIFFRLGIAGSPGAGKSTFIEAFGKYLLENVMGEQSNKKSKSLPGQQEAEEETSSSFVPNQIAVVCVDPSSSLTGGSILGDKTRMIELSQHERAYIRPAPTGGNLGGLAAYTDDVLSLCRIAGYDLMLVETVGLGQSEIEIAQSVDMLLLLISPGAGDDLQGAKKGIMEVADCILITKADGKLLPVAKRTATDYKNGTYFQMEQRHRIKREQFQQIMQLKQKGAVNKNNNNDYKKGIDKKLHKEADMDAALPILLVSSQTGEGMDRVWKEICKFQRTRTNPACNLLDYKRQEQSKYWMWKNIQKYVYEQINDNSSNVNMIQDMEKFLHLRKITPRVAAIEVLRTVFFNTSKNKYNDTHDLNASANADGNHNDNNKIA